ncbi:hypothetical protein DPMN_163038 [Dreissena polymorpha]|uniref:Uncharacterized protein n=1 Tax=Dreissena polymorpha TaxID=45954 RepID=A0A9D4EVV0_DREPO|nr:hypothetical protein DPMN_163038 [Dreissena polymorpha]
MISEGNDLTLQKCLDIARTYELTKSQMKSMNNSGIHAVASGSKRPKRTESKPKRKGRISLSTRTEENVQTVVVVDITHENFARQKAMTTAQDLNLEPKLMR